MFPLSTDCPPWTDDRFGEPERAEALLRRMEEARAMVARGEGPDFAASPSGALCALHGAMFGGTAPLECYAGRMRGEHPDAPCLARNVRVGGAPGTPYTEMPAAVEAFDRAARALLAQAAAAPPGDRAEAAVEAAAWIAAAVIRIHPFVNGNGRSSRLATNALLVAAGFPPDTVALERTPPAPYREIA